jgi:hypothetical protein
MIESTSLYLYNTLKLSALQYSADKHSRFYHSGLFLSPLEGLPKLVAVARTVATSSRDCCLISHKLTRRDSAAFLSHLYDI